VAKDVQALGRKAIPVVCDVTKVEDCDRTVEVAAGELGGIDILVNNAYQGGDMKPLMQADLDEWRKTFETNFFGSVQLTRACVPHMQARGEGRVVMINTQSALWTKPNYGAYASSKAALAQITKTLARELGPIGIRVNGIHPGFIWGDPVRGFIQGMADRRGVPFQTVYDEVAGETCLGYLPDSAEIAGSVLFLASPLAKPVTGQWFAVNCGHYLA
jgi:NAD(P)-dependent dehydrogenase (short-subunit alcohol dehydrogenase family)